jgi:hypothetical protein
MQIKQRLSIVSGAACSLLCLLPVMGCLETETTTVVQSDGSLIRSIALKADSAGLATGMRMFGVDSLWTLEQTGADPKERVLVARRSFRTVEAMSDALIGEPGRRIGIKPGFSHSYNWFFTTYRYEETWIKLNPTDAVPASDYLSAQEIASFERRITTPDSAVSPVDSVAVVDSGDRFNEWNSRNSYEEYYGLLRQGIRRLADPRLTEAMAESAKERCFEKARNFDWANGDLQELEKSLGEILGSPLLPKALDSSRVEIDAFRSRMMFQQSVLASSHKVHVVMPGSVTATNAGLVQAGTVSWDGFIALAYVGNYTMWVESREMNWWETVISGLILLGILAWGASAMTRRKSPASQESERK